jgi:hypothetical protein
MLTLVLHTHGAGIVNLITFDGWRSCRLNSKKLSNCKYFNKMEETLNTTENGNCANHVLTTVLVPIASVIEIYPNNKGCTTERVDDDEAEDGFYFKQVEYILEKPNLLVNAKIECDNDFRINHSYLSEHGIVWIAVSKNTIINQSNIMDKFFFPKEVVCIGSPFACGTGIPS